MKIAHISDFHFTKFTLSPFRLFPKRIFALFTWLKKRRKRFSFAQAESLKTVLQNLNVDLVLFGGDFTSSSLKSEFALAKDWLTSLDLPWFAVPGNHDNYTFRSFSKKHFHRFVKNASPTYASLKEDFVEAHKIAPKLWLILLDTTYPSLLDSTGLFSERLEKNLQTLLKKIPKTERIILLTHYPFLSQESKKRALRGKKRLRKVLEENPNISIYLHGHTHRSSISDLRSKNLPIVIDSGSSTDQKSSTFQLLDLGEDELQVTTYQFKQTWQEMKTRTFQWKN